MRTYPVIGTKACEHCGQEMEITSSTRDRRFCSLKCAGLASRKTAIKPCEWCGTEFDSEPAKNRRFCSKSCSAKARYQDPEYLAKLEPHWRNKTETQRAVASARMKRLNQEPEIQRKHAEASANRKGKSFAGIRGGNGSLTPQQKALAEATGYVMEYPIPTGNPSWRCAVVDLAKPELKRAIEVDGRSHDTPKQRERDRIKEGMLKALGWKLLRITNKEVDQGLDFMVRLIKAWECL